jgi:hypothetical protein
MNRPVLPTSEEEPASSTSDTTPGVTRGRVRRRPGQHRHRVHPTAGAGRTRAATAEQRVAGDQVRLPPAKTRRPQGTVWPLIVERGRRQRLPAPPQQVSPAGMVPAAWMRGFMSVRSAAARRTAPSMFSRPAPCCSRLARQRLGGVLQDGLDQRRRQPRVGLQHQRHRAGHSRRRHRGAAELHQRAARPACVAPGTWVSCG